MYWHRSNEVKVRFQTLLTHPINNVRRINLLNNRFTIGFRPQAWWLRRRWPPCLPMTWPPRPWTTKRRMRWFTKCTKTFRSIKPVCRGRLGFNRFDRFIYCVIRGGRNNSFVRRGRVFKRIYIYFEIERKMKFFNDHVFLFGRIR